MLRCVTIGLLIFGVSADPRTWETTVLSNPTPQVGYYSLRPIHPHEKISIYSKNNIGNNLIITPECMHQLQRFNIFLERQSRKNKQKDLKGNFTFDTTSYNWKMSLPSNSQRIIKTKSSSTVTGTFSVCQNVVNYAKLQLGNYVRYTPGLNKEFQNEMNRLEAKIMNDAKHDALQIYVKASGKIKMYGRVRFPKQLLHGYNVYAQRLHREKVERSIFESREARKRATISRRQDEIWQRVSSQEQAHRFQAKRESELRRIEAENRLYSPDRPLIQSAGHSQQQTSNSRGHSSVDEGSGPETADNNYDDSGYESEPEHDWRAHQRQFDGHGDLARATGHQF